MSDPLNALSEQELVAGLERCGGAAWARALAERRPVASDSLDEAIEDAWAALDEHGWREAFEAGAAAMPAAGEPGAQAAAETALALYRERFGRAFVTAAECETADELLMRIRIRLGLDERADWRASCDEQRRVTRRRLERLLRETG